VNRARITTIAVALAFLANADEASPHATEEHVKLAGLACNTVDAPAVLKIPSDDPPSVVPHI